MRIVKTFESFFNDHDDQEMMPHQAPNADMQQHPAAKIDHDDHHETENYMFFGNLETIHRLTQIMLKMDPLKVDQILKNGHSWAVDHIATSKDDIEEVANFLIGEMTEEVEEGIHDRDITSAPHTNVKGDMGDYNPKARAENLAKLKNFGPKDKHEDEFGKERSVHKGKFMDNPGNADYMAEGSYTCNECGISYEAKLIKEGDSCECGGTLVKQNMKAPIQESFWNSIFGKPSIGDAARTQLKGQGHSHTGREETGENYLVFNGQKFYPNDIAYADYQDLGELPRVENGKLIIKNPAWEL
jgi:hypothetical protein